MPLLQHGQDPDGLAALVAYHLHRNGIDIKQLHAADITFETARQLRQGTLQLNTDFVTQIATSLQLDTEDLTAPLTDDQKREWNFYRISARQVTEVWRRVAEASSAHSVSQRKLGELLEISQSAINRAINGERKSPVLNWHDAAKIAHAFQLDEGAEAFLPREFPNENARERG